MVDEQEYEDLCDFLGDARPHVRSCSGAAAQLTPQQVRAAAAELVQGLSGSDAGVLQARQPPPPLPPLSPRRPSSLSARPASCRRCCACWGCDAGACGAAPGCAVADGCARWLKTQKPLAEARCAATALVNLTADARAAAAALEKGGVERAMEHIHDPERAELRSLLVRARCSCVCVRGGAARSTRG